MSNLPDGTYLWKTATLHAYTHHRNGTIVWAEGTCGKLELFGVEVVLHISQAQDPYCIRISATRIVPNIALDAEELRFLIENHARLVDRYLELAPEVDRLFVWRLTDDLSLLDSGTESEMSRLMESLRSPTVAFLDIPMESTEGTLWELVRLEQAGFLKLVVPERLQVHDHLPLAA